MERSELIALAAQIVEDQECLCDLDYRLCLELGHLEDDERFPAEWVVYEELERLGYTGVYED